MLFRSYTTSTNGTTWTEPAIMNNTNDPYNMNGVAVNSAGRFAAVGYDSVTLYPVAATSTDGITWTTPSPLWSGQLLLAAVAVNSSGVWVAVGRDNTSPAYFTSNDGINWGSPNRFNGSAVTGIMNSVAVNSSGTWVAVGDRKSTRLNSSH